MSISSLRLDAFCALVQKQSFTDAAKHLFITQSALSQRIQGLESELNVSLFSRRDKPLILSEAGKKLFEYCLQRQELEDSLVSNFTSESDLSGDFYLGAVSTVSQHLVLPRIAAIHREAPNLNLNLATGNESEIIRSLRAGKYSFIYSNRSLEDSTYESTLVGFEEYVMLEAEEIQDSCRSTFLDIDQEDEITHRYLSLQTDPIKMNKRLFFSDIHLLADAVAYGLGRAVLPKHLLGKDNKLTILEKQRGMKLPVYFTHPVRKFKSKAFNFAERRLAERFCELSA